MPTCTCPVCHDGMAEQRLDDRNTLLRCSRCRHVVRDLDRCPAGARAHAYGGAGTLDRLRLQLVRRHVRRLLPPPARIFEIGYGSGALLGRLHADGYAVAGIDSGQAGLAPVPPVPAGALRHGAASALRPRADEAPYDLVLAIHVIEHVADPIETLSAACRLLRPGGRILVITPDADSLGLSLFGAAWWMLEDPTHIALFSPQSLTQALGAAGFDRPTIGRPLLESLSCEAASLRRRRHTGDIGGQGALADKRTLALAAAALPVDVVVRLVRPRLRPALLATAVRPQSTAPM